MLGVKLLVGLVEAGYIHALWRPYTPLLSVNVTHIWGNIQKNLFKLTGKILYIYIYIYIYVLLKIAPIFALIKRLFNFSKMRTFCLSSVQLSNLYQPGVS